MSYAHCRVRTYHCCPEFSAATLGRNTKSPHRCDSQLRTEGIVKIHCETPGSGASAVKAKSVFDDVIDRKHSNSLKWAFGKTLLSPEEFAADPLPMWVADMDFRAPPCVIDSLREAVESGVFGYSHGATTRYVDAVIAWQAKRFGWAVEREWVMQSSGIITALKNAIQAFSAPGDSVLIQPPVYAHFHDDVLLNGRQLVYAPLERAGTAYRFNAATFEAAIRISTKLFILSNPHNPTGNVWSENELRTMGEICLKYGVLVISDEIHQDLIINPFKKHIPYASLGARFAANSITCTAPSKTFNLPGLQSANLFVPDRRLRDELRRQFDRNMYQSVNTLGMVAAEAAYTGGESWLEALLVYLRDNHTHFRNAVHGLTSKIEILPADSLYLAWMDCRGLGMDPDVLNRFMLTEARLWFDKGQKFGVEGHGYMRANLGCPRSTIDEAIRRLTNALAAL
ncbi:MalY/PatB family protein [Paraburkholderia phenoliruptrix]|uniref:cysteine-S-conjugate beta-lyase n=1 Tax=Paraburkholderia phenoliruptrix TaxID=252970 RepID=A0ABV3WLG0_9BURK